MNKSLKNNLISFYENLKNKNLSKSFLYYWFTSGIIIALFLVVLEVISYNPNFVEIFAFLSGSFFLINFFQFYTVNSENKSAMKPFLVQTMIGGIVWVLYCLIMYVLYIKDISNYKNVFITLLSIILFSVTHIILVFKYDFYKKIGLYN